MSVYAAGLFDNVPLAESIPVLLDVSRLLCHGVPGFSEVSAPATRPPCILEIVE
jgi:hypothetical protein